MSKNKIKNSKHQPKKSKLAQAVILLALLAFVIYFVFSNFIATKEKVPNKDLERAMGNRTSYSFVKEGELSFTRPNGESISRIDIEIADDDEQRTTGLMFRDKMGENEGMLFIFPSETHQAFWMKNTILPLDIIFVNQQREIVKIHKNTTPYSELSYPSDKPAIYVVEVNAGYTDKYGIKEGDKIVWRR